MKKFVTLVLAVLMVAVMLVPAAAKVVADEPIASFNVNTGSVYAEKSHTILTRIGDNKTIAEITGYLLSVEGGKDYNYFYVFAVENQDGTYVVTETYTALGRETEGGIKSSVQAPENGFLVCYHGGDDTLATTVAAIEVGSVVTLEGVDLTELAALEAGDNPLDGVGKVTFSTAKTVEDEGNGGDDDSSAPADDSKPADESKPADDKNPDTGDATMVFALIALVTVAGAVVVARKRVR